MDFKRHIETAWNLTLKNVVSLILTTLVMVAVGALTLGILAPVTMAGYTQSLLLLIRDGREPKVQDLFAHMNLFLPLLGFGVAVFVATTIGFMLLFVPGLVITVAVTFCCIYMLPLMTDKDMSIVDAIKESYAMGRRGELVDHVIVVIIFMAITVIGGSIFIGVLFTQPLATLFLLSTYEEKIGAIAPPAPQE
jgi:membrane-anchored glycerophosphoryl diester phosphodiesterase (GDPDase)